MRSRSKYLHSDHVTTCLAVYHRFQMSIGVYPILSRQEETEKTYKIFFTQHFRSGGAPTNESAGYNKPQTRLLQEFLRKGCDEMQKLLKERPSDIVATTTVIKRISNNDGQT
jgi:hypothetical protein